MTRPESDLAQRVRVRARVLGIEREALARAKRDSRLSPRNLLPHVVDKLRRPRRLMVLPEHRRLRRLLIGLIVHRPQH
jgi:hypothetical protein